MLHQYRNRRSTHGPVPLLPDSAGSRKPRICAKMAACCLLFYLLHSKPVSHRLAVQARLGYTNHRIRQASPPDHKETLTTRRLGEAAKDGVAAPDSSSVEL